MIQCNRCSVLVTTLLALGTLSCGGAEQDPAPAQEAASPDTAIVEQEAAVPEADDPFDGFDIDRPGAQLREERLLALRLRNDGAEDAVVFADAGAGEVFLDSVAAGNWSRVDLVTQGPVVTLRTARSSGETVHRLDLSTVPDSVVEVIVGDPAVTP